MTNNQEIEKKYIIRSVEDVEYLLQKSNYVTYEKIEQNYLAVTKDEELRIRKSEKNKETNYFLTYKNGLGLIRDENEVEVSEQIYSSLNQLIHTKPLIKTRHKLMYEGFILEIDSYVTEEYQQLFILEVEFENLEEITLFEKLNIFENNSFKEVTEDKNYKNKNMWKYINK